MKVAFCVSGLAGFSLASQGDLLVLLVPCSLSWSPAEHDLAMVLLSGSDSGENRATGHPTQRQSFPKPHLVVR